MRLTYKACLALLIGGLTAAPTVQAQTLTLGQNGTTLSGIANPMCKY